jgi:predicted AlkP superfamily pyrophosphatase or phosphodiesterase
MKSSVVFRVFFYLAVAVGLAGTPVRAAESKPALVVVISIDQFRYDYLTRFDRYFGEGGFHLLEQGANFVDCHHAHSLTKTGPGHAVMLTGVHANLHGIIGNDWIDRASLLRVSCVGDPTVQMVGLPANLGPFTPGFQDPHLGRSPKNLLVTTVGDELKLDSGNRSKVIGISNKDRAAILMAGKAANAAYFMEEGEIVSSTYYMKELPAWVKTWNAQGKAAAYFGKVWDRALPLEAYAQQGPDNAPGEENGANHGGNTLPKTINGGEATIGPKFFDAFEYSPFSNEVLEDFVETAVENEALGSRDGVTDLLCVSFSANDHIGHSYGPDSHEIMDNVVRMDRTLAKLFAYLDQKVGLKRCTFVLTADHGVSPMPEHVKATNANIPAGRFDPGATTKKVEQALIHAFGPLAGTGRWVVPDQFSFILVPTALAEKNVTSAAAQNVIRDALLQEDYIEAVYTRQQLEAGDVHDEFGRKAVLSFNRERSGDVFFQTLPFFYARKNGSDHGQPYNYDSHVPLIWYGVGVKPGVYPERAYVMDLAPTLSRILGLPAPPRSDGRVLF